jgi:peptidyl-prolyl cis-trans isomerase C
MDLADKQQEYSPEFSYHLLRNSLNDYGKNLVQLEPEQYQQVLDKASKSYELESLVIAAPESSDVVIPEDQLSWSMANIAARYDSRQEYLQDLEANGLDETGLRHSLYRELMFDAVMQLVASSSPAVSDAEVQQFYEMHPERFEQSELRSARHILITVNPEFPENSREAALARMEQVAKKLNGKSEAFAELARANSECPTAMEEGKLGELKQGQLYPELDAALFSMQEGEVSQIIESEMGFHILLCEKIGPGKHISFEEAEPKIRSSLEERSRRSRQKEWLAGLKKKA